MIVWISFGRLSAVASPHPNEWGKVSKNVSEESVSHGAAQQYSPKEAKVWVSPSLTHLGM